MNSNGGLIEKTVKLAAIAGMTALLVACSISHEQDAAAIERDILATPGGEELYGTIKDEFPQDFAALVAQIQTLDFSERRNEARIQEIGAAWLQRFFNRITPDAVSAPAQELLAWSAAEHDLYATLQRTAVSECASLTMGEWIFIDDTNTSATAAIARRNTAMVRASAAGNRDPQEYDEPDDIAFGRLGDSIAATGIDPELQAALGSGQAMLALTREEQCQIGVALYAGLANLPDDVEPELAAYMLSPDR